jgi:glycosyltransferase involved in cell wall biosynthesis
MLVGTKVGNDPDVEQLSHGAVRFLDKVAHRAEATCGVQYLADVSSFRLPRHPWFRDADVLQLYNIHGGWFAHTALPRLAARKPVVWRLSDMWSLTGHCGYAYGCERWRIGCGECPDLAEYPAVRRDATAFNWRVKQRIYNRTELVIVAPSRWIAGLVAESPLLGRYRVESIPNGVDTEFFSVRDRAEAQRKLGIPAGERVVLVASLQARKGGDIALAALEAAAQAHGPLTALVMGPREIAPSDRPGVRVVDLGVVDDEDTVRAAYCAAEVMLQPTLADNLPNSILESMAVGTPVIALARGGVVDAITHTVDGYLVDEPSPQDLGAAVVSLLTDQALRDRLAEEARRTIEDRFSLGRQAEAFRALYEELAPERTAG